MSNRNDCGNDGSQLGSVLSQLTSGNINALDLLKEARDFFTAGSQDYHAMSVVNKDEKRIQTENKHDTKAIDYLGSQYHKNISYARTEAGQAAEAGQDAAGDTAKGNFRHAAGENQFAANELGDAANAVNNAIGDRTRQNTLKEDITDNRQRKSVDAVAYNTLRADAKYDTRTGGAELKLANIFHELGLG